MASHFLRFLVVSVSLSNFYLNLVFPSSLLFLHVHILFSYPVSLQYDALSWKEIPNGSILMGQGFPGGAVVKNPPANAEDTGLIPGLGRSHMPRSS